MIHVQIASQLTAQGMAGVRWVLVEPIDAQQPGGFAPDAQALVPPAQDAGAPSAAGPAPSVDNTSGALRLGALKLLVVALGLGAALWTAHVQVGPPGATAPAPAPSPARAPAMPAFSTPVQPGAGPLAPAQPPAAPLAAPPGAADPAAPAASAALPRLTASL